MTSLGDNPFDDTPTEPGIDAMELLSTIRDQARPSWAPELDRLMLDADRNGWTIENLSKAVNRDLGAGAGPGVTMMLMRRLCKLPPPKERTVTGREAAIIGHAPCNLPQHPDNCQICHCDRGRENHVEVEPMPEWFKEQFASKFRSFGRIPDA